MPKFDVVLLPSFAQVESWRKQQADSRRAGMFTQVATTFNAWIADLWELHGDGRAIVDSLQRLTIMHAAFGPSAEDGPFAGELTASSGIVKLAAQCVREAAGLTAFDEAVAQATAGRVADALDTREAALLAGIGRYYELLEAADLVELGACAAILARDSATVFPRPLRVLIPHPAPLSWCMQAFFEACDAIEVQAETVAGDSAIGCMPGAVRLSFGFPAGRYAQPALVADVVRQLGGDGDVVVACKDPIQLYKQMEPALVREHVGCSVQAQVAFSSTDFGRQFLSLCRVVGEGAWYKEDLSDAARPPFSGFDRAQSLQIDRELRQNRLADKEGCLSALRMASDTFSQLEELANDPDADVLMGVFEQIAFTLPGRSEAWRTEQLAAASAVRSCTKAARAVGAPMSACAEVLEDAKVTVSYESFSPEGPQSARRVVVTTQDAAAQMGQGACAHLVACDLTAEDYPVADRDDAASTLFGKLGFTPFDSALQRSRRTFAALQSLPTESAVLVRPLNDWDGNPTYPCAMLQELIDSYRQDPSSDDDVDDVFGLPDQLRGGLVQRGEERLYANARALPAESRQPRDACVAAASLGDMPRDLAPKVALSRSTADGAVLAGFSPSPSQVEVYLECPYKWFAQRRVNVEWLDEGFGALERGSFCHAVLQAFYREFSEMGHAKVNAENLAQAKKVMRQIADREEIEQRQMDPGSGRYVAVDQMERRELQACKDQLVGYLDFEKAFLPGFSPAYLEYEIGPSAGVVYAGRPFMGIVDRIDVDGAGNAVIVDYKGSVGPAYEIGGKNDQVPGKVQTRMYARAVQRALGLNVVGALYVSYGATHGCAGAVDARVVEAAHLPHARIDRCRCAAESPLGDGPVEDFALLSFEDMLDATEHLVERAIESMECGRVQPDPATSEACRFCPVSHCPKRGAR